MEEKNNSSDSNQSFDQDLLSKAGIDMPSLTQYVPPKKDNKNFVKAIALIAVLVVIFGAATIILSELINSSEDDSTASNNLLEFATTQEQFKSAFDIVSEFNSSMASGNYSEATNATVIDSHIHKIVSSSETASKEFGVLDWKSCQLEDESIDEVIVNINEDGSIFRSVNVDAVCTTQDTQTPIAARYVMRQLNEDASGAWYVYDFYTSPK